MTSIAAPGGAVAPPRLLSLIIPVYNEGERVDLVVRTLFTTLRWPFEIIAVYDFQEDTTLPVLRRLAAEFPSLRYVCNVFGRGVVGAVRTGFSEVSGDTVGIWCAYHIDPTGVLNIMMDQIAGGFDVVAANRFVATHRFARGSMLKRLLSRTGNFLFWRLTGFPLGDVTTSIKLYRRSVIEHLPLETKQGGGWALNMELAIKAYFSGARITEVRLSKEGTLLGGITKFRIKQYAPEYLHWFAYGLRHGLARRGPIARHPALDAKRWTSEPQAQ